MGELTLRRCGGINIEPASRGGVGELTLNQEAVWGN